MRLVGTQGVADDHVSGNMLATDMVNSAMTYGIDALHAHNVYTKADIEGRKTGCGDSADNRQVD